MKTKYITTQYISLISILRFSLLAIFCMFAMMGMSQTLEIAKTPGSDYALIIGGNNSGNCIFSKNISLTTGLNNVFVGNQAGMMTTTGSGNVFLGFDTGNSNNGMHNTFVGAAAGRQGTTGSGNVFLGYRAGHFETGDNQLYISNDTRANALIRGDFTTEQVTVNGSFTVTDVMKLTATSADPGCTTNAEVGKLWMTPVGAGTTLKVCRGAALGWQDLY